MHLVAPISSLASVLLLLLLAFSFLDDKPLGFSSPCFSFALLPSALSYLWVLLSSYWLVSVFAVHCSVLAAVDFCSLCVPIWTSQDSSEIYAYCCWCFMCLSALLCFCRLHVSSLPLSTSTASYQSEMDMNQSTLTKVKYQMQKKKRASTEVSRKLAPWKT